MTSGTIRKRVLPLHALPRIFHHQRRRPPPRRPVGPHNHFHRCRNVCTRILSRPAKYQNSKNQNFFPVRPKPSSSYAPARLPSSCKANRPSANICRIRADFSRPLTFKARRQFDCPKNRKPKPPCQTRSICPFTPKEHCHSATSSPRFRHFSFFHGAFLYIHYIIPV